MPNKSSRSGFDIFKDRYIHFARSLIIGNRNPNLLFFTCFSAHWFGLLF
jgi:hypothetical protein